MKSLALPLFLEEWIQSQLQKFSLSLKQSQTLAQSIQRMADFYIEHPTAPTPWHESWCQQAQLAYYFPLNFLRNWRVFQELHQQNFFDQSFHWYEFGSGLAPSLEAFLHSENESLSSGNEESNTFEPASHSPTSLLSTKTLVSSLRSIQLLEKSVQAQELSSQRLQSRLPSSISIHSLSQIPKSFPPSSLLIFSYSFTELEKAPEWLWSADSIIIIEPSTREDGRRLLALREEALQKGFQVIAPCTHSQKCPLLTHSKKDWCHDRFAFERPAWMLEIEKHLPFKNATLTLSYLALKRQRSTSNSHAAKSLTSPLLPSHPSPSNSLTLAFSHSPPIRVVGDFLDEKGKSRQLICRGPEREFLTFLKKNNSPPEYFRGDLLLVEGSIEKKGDELRLQPHQIKLLQK